MTPPSQTQDLRTRVPQFPDFPFTEYQQRYRRLRSAMEQHGLDAILVTQGMVFF